MRYKFLLTISLIIILTLLPIIIAEEITITPDSNKDPSESTNSNDQKQAPEETNTNTAEEENKDSEDSAKDPKEITKGATNAAKEAIMEGINKERNKSDVESIPLPDLIKEPTRALFQVKDGNITLEVFIVLFGFFIMLFIILYELLSEIFDKKIITSLSALIICGIVSLSGLINKIKDYYFNIFDYGTLKTTFTIFLIIVISLFVLKFLISIFHKFKHKGKVEAAKRAGTRARVTNELNQDNAKKIVSISNKINK